MSPGKQQDAILAIPAAEQLPKSTSRVPSCDRTPWPSALVKAGPLLWSVLKNWWVKCWAKNVNITFVPCGSGINFLLSRNFSTISFESGSSFLPVRETDSEILKTALYAVLKFILNKKA